MSYFDEFKPYNSLKPLKCGKLAVVSIGTTFIKNAVALGLNTATSNNNSDNNSSYNVLLYFQLRNKS